MKRFILAIASFFFLPCLTLAIFFLNISHTFLSPEIYKTILIQTNAYERVLDVNANEFSKYLIPKGTPIPQQITDFKLRNFISKETLQNKTENFLDDFFIKVLRQGQATVVIDLKEIKNAILKNNRLPLNLLPSNIVADNYTVHIPANILFIQPFIRFLPLITYALFAFSFIFLILIIWTKQGLRSKIRLPAYLIFSTGIIYLITYYSATFFNLSQIIPNGSNDLIKIVIDVTEQLKMEFLKPYFIEGIILTSISVLAFIVSFLLPKHSKKIRPKEFI